jgi:hypothetical protein
MRTKKLTKSTERLALYEGKPVGIVLNEDELSANQRLQALYNADRYVVVRHPNGCLDMIDGEHGGEYDFVDAEVIHRQDGSFEVVKVAKDELPF